MNKRFIKICICISFDCMNKNKMDSEKLVEASESCRCCLVSGRTRRMANICMETNKNYKDMLMECFNININGAVPWICDACITRLIDAYKFRGQVCETQNHFYDTTATTSTEIKVECADWLYTGWMDPSDDAHFDDVDKESSLSSSDETLNKLQSISEGSPKKITTETKPSDGDLDVRKALLVKKLNLLNEIKAMSNSESVAKTIDVLKKTSNSILESTNVAIVKKKIGKSNEKFQTEAKSKDGNINVREALLVKKLALLNEIEAMSNSETVAKTIDVLKKTSNNVLKSKNDAKNRKKTKITNTKKVKLPILKVQNTKEEKLRIKASNSKSLKDQLKNKFNDLKCLRRDCKDFYLFILSVSKYICPICEVSYMDIDTFKTHARQHTSEETERFFRKRKIDIERLRVDISTMKCSYCGECATELESFRAHLSHSHNIKSDDLFRSLMPFDLKTDEVKCFICNKVFMNIVNLNIHMNEHYTNFLCPHCGKPFVSIIRLKSHIRRLHSTGTFKCIHCDETFETFAKRDYHVSVTHYIRWNLCPLCPEKLRTHQAKLVHLAEVHNQEMKKYKCESCPEKFVTAGFLSSHIRRVHLNERNHICSVCGDAFFIMIELKHHMVKHTGEKSFQCQVCEKAYSRKKTLQAHMRIHNNDRRHCCQFCGRAFVQKCALKSHLSHVHKDEIENS